ncbi:uncharacterized protein LOC132630663 [Lycium barbarum]|uniref:uncharacterized protein LOC132630663 n=1 Tax=Lycium barbarum TaxID=112863 RepID=UPI00293F58B2|nr:uncharacterized protein LOC132630663 [Lycium barbarum]
MHATETEASELEAYQLQDVAYIWYETWEQSHGEDASPATWDEFSDAFIDHFHPIEVREAKAYEFERLRKNGMSVNEYYLKFVSLARYAQYMLPDMRAIVRRFMLGLIPDLNSDSWGRWGRKFFKSRSSGPASSAASAPAPKFRNDQKRWNSRPTYSYSEASVGQKTYDIPVCSKCGKRHPGVYRIGMDVFYGCGQQGHFQRDFPSARQCIGGGGQNRLYALAGCHDTEACADVVTVVVLVDEPGIGSIEASKSIACPSCTRKRLKVYCVLCGILFVLLGNVFGLKGVDGYRWIKCLGWPDLCLLKESGTD